jgi:hypothetical protein
MEIVALIIAILFLVIVAATIAALLREGSGYTPPATSDQAGSTLDPRSSSYTMRIF